jgi:hypothetical protein
MLTADPQAVLSVLPAATGFLGVIPISTAPMTKTDVLLHKSKRYGIRPPRHQTAVENGGERVA